MAKFYSALNEPLREFIGAQHMFFNASAPNQGRINISPKGLDTFRILSDTRVAYLDLTGSENETAAHLAVNGRLTLMFCSYDEKPLIVRLYGHGSVVHTRDPQWHELRPQFPPLPGERQIIVLDIESIMTTCGFAVPLYDFKAHRDQLTEFSCKMGEERMNEYRHEKNLQSIDGLPTHLFEDAPQTWQLEPEVHYLLTYEKVADHAQREPPFQSAHRDHVFAALARGEMVLGGPLLDPEDGANVILFRGESAAVAESFAKADPYVVNGIVTKWRVRPWQTVVGRDAECPITK